MPTKKVEEVVILGGGVFGFSIAYHLAKEGIPSQVIEMDAIGAKASGKADGMIGGAVGMFFYAGGAMRSMLPLGEESYRRLKQVFPPWEIPLNPFDTGVTGQMTKDRDVVQHFVETAGQDPAADCLAVQLGAPSQITGQSGSDDESLVRPYTEAVAAGKTVVCWTVNPLAGRHLVELLESRRIPVFPSAERAIRALGRMWEYGQRTK